MTTRKLIALFEDKLQRRFAALRIAGVWCDPDDRSGGDELSEFWRQFYRPLLSHLYNFERSRNNGETAEQVAVLNRRVDHLRQAADRWRMAKKQHQYAKELRALLYVWNCTMADVRKLLRAHGWRDPAAPRLRVIQGGKLGEAA